MLKHVPNILTLLRFVLIVPIVTSIAYEEYIMALIFLVVSGLTDVLDDEKIKLLNIFVANHQNYLDSFNEPIIVRVLNQGIKIGMQIQEAFNEFEAT